MVVPEQQLELHQDGLAFDGMCDAFGGREETEKEKRKIKKRFVKVVKEEKVKRELKVRIQK